jgi:hypothetical protein
MTDRKASAPRSRDRALTSAPARVAPAWGWRAPFTGRAAHVAVPPEFQATTNQACGLFPFMAGSGTPLAGTPVGRHLLWGEMVCLDPLAWLRAGLVTNPACSSSASPAPASPPWSSG